MIIIGISGNLFQTEIILIFMKFTLLSIFNTNTSIYIILFIRSHYYLRNKKFTIFAYVNLTTKNISYFHVKQNILRRNWIRYKHKC